MGGGSRAHPGLAAAGQDADYADSTAAPAWHPPSGAGGSGEGRRRGWPNLWTLRPPPGWRLRSLFPPVGEEGGEWGWGAISFESEPMLGGAQSSVPGRRRGPRSVLHAAAGGRGRATPEQAPPRKVLLDPPRLARPRAPSPHPRPAEPLRAIAASGPVRVATTTPSSKETIIIALLAWWGRDGPPIASGAQDFRSRVRGRPGPRAGRPGGGASGSPALASRCLLNSLRFSPSSLFLLPVSLSLCLLPLPSTACLCTL